MYCKGDNVFLAIVLAIAMLGSKPAMAQLKLCNNTDHVVYAAIGYFGLQGWTSEGWWTVYPNRCQYPIRKPLDKRYYYVLGKNQDFHYHAGGVSRFCVSQNMFQVFGDQNCEERGYREGRFGGIAKGKSIRYSADFVMDMEKRKNGNFGFISHESKNPQTVQFLP